MVREREPIVTENCDGRTATGSQDASEEYEGRSTRTVPHGRRAIVIGQLRDGLIDASGNADVHKPPAVSDSATLMPCSAEEQEQRRTAQERRRRTAGGRAKGLRRPTRPPGNELHVNRCERRWRNGMRADNTCLRSPTQRTAPESLQVSAYIQERPDCFRLVGPVPSQ